MIRLFSVVLLTAVTISACAPSTAYRKAESEPAVKLPDDVTLEGEKTLYPIPDNGPVAEWDEEDDEFQVPRPPRIREPEKSPEEEAPAPAPAENTRVVLARDGSGYPIIMMHTRFAWAWEYVGQALKSADFKIEDRDRASGIYYIKVPKPYRGKKRDAQIKLSQTANGIQIAVLKPDGSALLDKGPGQDILSRLYDEL